MTNEELKASPIGVKLTAAGYDIWNTGGNIMCWARETPSQTLIYIGQGDGDCGEDGREDNWGTCVTSADGDYLEEHTMEGALDDCLAKMKELS